MGTGSSVEKDASEKLPNIVGEADAKQYLGTSFDSARFKTLAASDATCAEGLVTKSLLLLELSKIRETASASPAPGAASRMLRRRSSDFSVKSVSGEEVDLSQYLGMGSRGTCS